MQALSAPNGLNNAFSAVTGTKQPGPPDHAKAWGWRAKQAEAAEATQAATTDTAAPSETETASEGTGAVEAIAATPPPSEADMESVILSLIADFGETSGSNTQPLYDQVQALFS